MKLLALLLTSLAYAGPTTINGPVVGTVAIVEGNGFAQKGEIYYTRPRVGAQIKVNEFGQYKDSRPVPAFVKWIQNTRRHLKDNDQIQVGDLIQTAGDGWLKILFNDDSILDIGPATVVQVQKFEGRGEQRRIFFKLLYGRVRNVVTQPLAGPEHYQLITPNILLGVRGTEFLVNVVPDKDGVTQTEVVCLHGQVSVDVPKHTDKGVVYHQPVVVNPGMVFSTSGVHGLGQETRLRALPQKELRSHVARISPLVNVNGTVVGSTPGPSRLLGTGIPLGPHHGIGRRMLAKKGAVSSFDMDHMPAQRAIASPSGNFTIPNTFAMDSAASGNLGDYRKSTGPSPIDQLPLNTSRVTVRLNGL